MGRCTTLGCQFMLLASLSPLLMSQQTKEATIRRIVGVNYPRLANLAGIQGVVELSAKIGKDGSVVSVQVLSGKDLLAQPAKEILQRWQFDCLEQSEKCNLMVHLNFELLNEMCTTASCPSEFEMNLRTNEMIIRSKRLPAIVN